MRKKKSLPGDVMGDLTEVFQNNNMYAWEKLFKYNRGVHREKAASPGILVGPGGSVASGSSLSILGEIGSYSLKSRNFSPGYISAADSIPFKTFTAPPSQGIYLLAHRHKT